MRKIILISFIGIVLDRIIKSLLLLNMDMGDSITIINNFWNITLISNTGAAFSILSSNTPFLIIVSLFTIILIYFLFIKEQELKNYQKILYGILLGGIIGNLIDRIIYGAVVDYLDFNIFGYNFPVFNLADIFIVVGVILIIIDVFKGAKNEVSSGKWWN